ncbi:anthranilate synthase component I family protein [Agromyces flavus]
MIGECQAAIVRGDAYQLCLTNRVDVDASPDPVAAYLRLRRSSPSHHGGFVRFDDVALLSASPEQFLLVERDGTIATKPMKGTRPRSGDPATDLALRAELSASEKERAENLMIVDLMRNDLGRIAEVGSVQVPSLLEVEEYPHVHQLVSTVTARLRHPLTALDAVRSAFPAGSMTGAPKLSAMTILHGLEQGPRGVYSGAFGCLGADGTADLAMVIRSILLTPSGASIGTGGGITALSDPDEEVEETRVKARALIAVLGGEVPDIDHLPDAIPTADAAAPDANAHRPPRPIE